MSTRRVLLGKRNVGEYGMWVAKSGADVFSSTVSDFLLELTQTNTPYVASGILTALPFINTSGANDNYGIIITHGVGDVPVVVLMFDSPTGFTINFNITNDATNFAILYSQAHSGSPPGTISLSGKITYMVAGIPWV